ncbi:tetraspanin-11 isoform X1 [Vulpes vulpes]|uniref:Tetraspanin-11 isoform X1 n=1 Tax=Vulpes vulpes TaxID=9627 RepID=A0ABM5B5I8_VULVU
MAHYKVEQDDWLIVYLKYLLFVFNFFFWVGGATVLAVGVWTLVEKSGYLSILASSTFAASAYILIFSGALVMVTGFLGFGAIIREDRSCLSTYFCLLLVIFLVELVAGVLAHMYYQRLSEELKQHLTRTLAENYRQPGAVDITLSVDRLQQDFKCCGSNSSADWQHSAYILSREAEGRRVPDSCCKTVVVRCGQRVHPSNIYKVEGGCITKLEQFLADHLLLMGAVGIGVACLQGRPPRKQKWWFTRLSVDLGAVSGAFCSCHHTPRPGVSSFSHSSDQKSPMEREAEGGSSSWLREPASVGSFQITARPGHVGLCIRGSTRWRPGGRG